MFGRLFKISIINSAGESVILVDTVKRRYNDYICSGTIERFPGSQTDCLTLSIYNLDPVIRGEISVGTYDTIKVDFGYEDEGGILTTIFEGKIIRPQHRRADVVTDEAVIYAYDSGDFKTYGFCSKTYLDGTNYYDIAEDIAKRGNVPISCALSEKLKQYTVKGSKTFYCTQNEALEEIADTCGLTYKTENNVARIFGNDDTLEEVVVFSKMLDDGNVVAESGLIGIPTLTSDGLRLKCLIIPTLKVYSHISISNSIISNEISGAVPSASAGGQLNSSGRYRINKLTIHFSNNSAQNYMELKAISLDVFEEIVNE